ncbi:1-pyrroline-5-carboxylate dehydrogenase [Vibrio hannami]|uniref:1-pyrroline-5-carboxylate dehydrogenase n=1 Tax=Vibrio hannami TaxID=2717094 RepID=UPI0024100A84|nr:1-pyrroline-5-carboxylate dehydrogenase [Vibrio hannami]MDG3087779.1 1-pyrroline-5-carboxylate dehydrogenase [Vibrio hannami]
MKPIQECYNAAFSAFELWNLTDFSNKKQALAAVENLWPEGLSKVAQYQFAHAESVVSTTHSLVSPTGETNELYTQGRGVAVLLFDSDAQYADKALVAMVTALLTAGNSVIVCSDNSRVKTLIEASNIRCTLPENLIQIVERDKYTELLNLDIRNFVLIGSANSSVSLSEALAMRPNAITSMVAETDLESLPHSKDPKLVLRFITEKVKSINITAIGGNAMLLELGNTVH